MWMTALKELVNYFAALSLYWNKLHNERTRKEKEHLVSDPNSYAYLENIQIANAW